MNPHCRVFLEQWQANIDFRLTIDVGKIVLYMTKYVTKTETSKRSTSLMLCNLQKLCDEGNDQPLKILSKLMTSTIGERSVVKQEVCHRIMSEALVYSSCSGRYVSLENQLNEISIENNNDNGNESTIIVVWLNHSYGFFSKTPR